MKTGDATTASSDGSTLEPHFDRLAATGTPTVQAAPFVATCREVWQAFVDTNPVCQMADGVGDLLSVQQAQDYLDLVERAAARPANREGGGVDDGADSSALHAA